MLDMREYAQRVVELTTGQKPERFGPGGDWRLQASLERMLELIGEAPQPRSQRSPGAFSRDSPGRHCRYAKRSHPRLRTRLTLPSSGTRPRSVPELFKAFGARHRANAAIRTLNPLRA
jgi:hypothetical protein